MKALFWIGLVVLILGVVSLVMPIPRNEREGFMAGLSQSHSERGASD